MVQAQKCMPSSSRLAQHNSSSARQPRNPTDLISTTDLSLEAAKGFVANEIKVMVTNSIAWLTFLLRPRRTMNNLVDCFRLYDPSAWDANLELLDSGLKLAADILIPAALLSLIASFLPSSCLGETVGVGKLPPCIDVFSPYTPHSLALSRSSPHATFGAVHHSLFLNFNPSYLVRCLFLSMFSPITIDVLLRNFAPILIQILSRLQVVISSRKGPDISTKLFLLERVRMGRAIRRRRYDLYLPPKLSYEMKPDCIQSLLFFPGFGIDHNAYARVASRMSDSGIYVAVVSLEPLRLAHKSLGGGMNDVQRLIQLAEQDVVAYEEKIKNKEHYDERRPESIIVEWALGGHSMGGYNALQLAEVLQSSDGLHNLSSTSKMSHKIVAWAAGTDVNGFPDLSNCSSLVQLRVFILLASNDKFARITSLQQKHRIISKLPTKSRLETIKGGNHCGFASYPESSIDGLREISLEAQHEAASSWTIKFLLEI